MEYNGPHAYQPPVVALAVRFFLEETLPRQGAAAG